VPVPFCRTEITLAPAPLLMPVVLTLTAPTLLKLMVPLTALDAVMPPVMFNASEPVVATCVMANELPVPALLVSVTFEDPDHRPFGAPHYDLLAELEAAKLALQGATDDDLAYGGAE